MAIDRIHPDAAGDETNLTPSAGNNYACVDEWIVDGNTHDGDTTVVFNSTDADQNWKRDLYNVGATSGSGAITKISVKAYCKWEETGTSPGTPQVKLSVKPSGGSVDEKTAQALTTSYVLYDDDWTVNPADSEAWEWADLADLQVGVSLEYRITDKDNYGIPYCTQVYLEITYADTHTETIDITSLLRDTDTDTLALDSRLEAKDTKTADLSSLLQALGITSTADLTALIKALADTKTANLDVRIGDIFEKTLALDTFLGHRYVIDGHWRHRPAHKVVIETRGGGAYKPDDG